MTVVINGTTGISPVSAAGTSATIDGMTVGRGAGEVSTNTAVGASALAANTTGAEVSVFGSTAGLNNTASELTAFGSQTAKANTSGARNAAFGRAALYSNTTGGSNTAIGNESLLSNTTASNNTAVGYQAGYTTATGDGNTFLGYKAGYSSAVSSAGAYNTAVGLQAGFSLTTGVNNTFIGGVNSGYYITTGSKNTIIGCYSGNLGGLDIRTASNYIVLSDGDGNPRGYFDNNGTFFVSSTIGVIYSIGVYNTTTASAANINVSSTGAFSRSTSALKYKQDVRDLESMDISLLRPVRYKSKCEGDDQTKDHLGLIADEAAEAGFEELVTRGADGEIEGFQYERLTVVLLKKLQVLEAKLTALENK